MKKERINLYLNILQGFSTLVFLKLYKKTRKPLLLT